MEHMVGKSKYLSYLLRHNPDKIGLKLDENGWALIDDIIRLTDISLADLLKIVETDEKKRYTISPNGDKIRAAQGHSISVNLDYIPQMPPRFLYHGTAEKFLPSILKEGLSSQKRQHVHLSEDYPTAIKVGKRHGAPVILQIDAMRMFQQGYSFFKADNDVWLTSQIPIKYIKRIPEEK